MHLEKGESFVWAFQRQLGQIKTGDPGVSRTRDLAIRNRSLYPSELRGHSLFIQEPTARNKIAETYVADQFEIRVGFSVGVIPTPRVFSSGRGISCSTGSARQPTAPLPKR